MDNLTRECYRALFRNVIIDKKNELIQLGKLYHGLLVDSVYDNTPESFTNATGWNKNHGRIKAARERMEAYLERTPLFQETS